MNIGAFVSSTFEDLKDHRQEVREVIRKLGIIDISMEMMGARDERPKSECIRLISKESQLFVGVYAYRYGYIPDGDTVSIMETEYLAASECQLPRFIFLVDESTPWLPTQIERGAGEVKLNSFKARLKANHVCEFFGDANDLAKRVAASLGRQLWLGKIERVSGNSKQSETDPSPVIKATPRWNEVRNGVYAQSKGFFLVHTLVPSNTPGQLFDISIYLLRHKSDDFSPVVSAEFFLGKYWNDRVFRISNTGEGPIGINTSAYGPFLCVCQVHFSDNTDCLLHRYIDFEAGLRRH